MSDYGDWEAVIGLEVHAQLLTASKLFCGCAVLFGENPNHQTCPVCLALPGALPVLNAQAVRYAVRAALALGCELQGHSVFARKNYFYPDLPKGYQISQYELPFSKHGQLDLVASGQARTVRLTRIHMEEDAGKNLHGMGSGSVVDLNRAGTPLIEIVSEPDLREPEEAAEYMKRLREVLMAVGVNDGNLEQGSFRCDANVSVRKKGDDQLGTRTELKNINSFKFVTDAIDGEIRRQIALLESGQRIVSETRGYNPDKRSSYAMRSKENDAGYRYFPDPDLPSLELSAEFLDGERAQLPELPEQKRERYQRELDLTAQTAQVLTNHPAIARYFEQACAVASPSATPTRIANFLQSEVLRHTTTHSLDATFPISPIQLAELVLLVGDSKISGKQAKEVFAKISGSDRSPKELCATEGIEMVDDRAGLEAIIVEIIATNERHTSQYRAGKVALLGFFVGQVMKATGGSADPALVNELLKAKLDGG